VTARATRAGDPTIVFSILLNLVGPPANILISASPTQVRCGEKSTVTAIVVDSAGQTVSDNTSVEFVVNLGGTGTAGRIFGPVAPLSSGIGFTAKGIATFLVLTSEVNVGTYDIVAQADVPPDRQAPTASTRISCSVPAAAPTAAAAAAAPVATTVAAPASPVRPPNTGDGGLLP
jgi:hypothetical protein